jgi:hypothetical protein
MYAQNTCTYTIEQSTECQRSEQSLAVNLYEPQTGMDGNQRRVEPPSCEYTRALSRHG